MPWSHIYISIVHAHAYSHKRAFVRTNSHTRTPNTRVNWYTLTHIGLLSLASKHERKKAYIIICYAHIYYERY